MGFHSRYRRVIYPVDPNGCKQKKLNKLVVVVVSLHTVGVDKDGEYM